MGTTLLRRAGPGHQEDGSQCENSVPRGEGEHGLHGHDQHEPTTGEWNPDVSHQKAAAAADSMFHLRALNPRPPFWCSWELGLLTSHPSIDRLRFC